MTKTSRRSPCGTQSRRFLRHAAQSSGRYGNRCICGRKGCSSGVKRAVLRQKSNPNAPERRLRGSFFFRQTSDFSALARIFLPPPATASIATDSERRTPDNAYCARTASSGCDLASRPPCGAIQQEARDSARARVTIVATPFGWGRLDIRVSALTQLCHHTKNFSKRESFSLFQISWGPRRSDRTKGSRRAPFRTSAEASSSAGSCNRQRSPES
jgi:hypothetical protein